MIFSFLFNLGDYIHNNPGTISSALTHSPNGTRPSSDFNVFGRKCNTLAMEIIMVLAYGKTIEQKNFPGYQPKNLFFTFPHFRE